MINSIPQSLQSIITRSLGSKLGKIIQLKNFKFSSGGCINETGILETTEGDFFLKWNQKSLYPDMFEKEKRGLELLNSADHNLSTPKPILTRSDEQHIFLILENIVSTWKQPDYWQKLGNGLAQLHRNSHKSFGLDHDNYIGSLKQTNTENENWLDFFRENRIEFMFKMASDSGFFNKSDKSSLDNMFRQLEELCPDNMHASLLHGDLWSGNLMVDNEGKPCLIDPAVYFGFREMEIAYTELFGRFDEDFYDSYNEEWPLEVGYEERKNIWNLYPLLVHVNLFGGSYATSVKSILNKFS